MISTCSSGVPHGRRTGVPSNSQVCDIEAAQAHDLTAAVRKKEERRQWYPEPARRSYDPTSAAVTGVMLAGRSDPEGLADFLDQDGGVVVLGRQRDQRDLADRRVGGHVGP